MAVVSVTPSIDLPICTYSTPSFSPDSTGSNMTTFTSPSSSVGSNLNCSSTKPERPKQDSLALRSSESANSNIGEVSNKIGNHISGADLTSPDSDQGSGFPNSPESENLHQNLPAHDDEKIQNAFSLLQKTLDFLSNEYGVHYALLSCYRRRRQIIHSIEDSEPEELESEASGGPLSYTVVASGSAGLASGFFLDPQGPGQKCLASWTEFCTDFSKEEEMLNCEPFAFTKHIEATSPLMTMDSLTSNSVSKEIFETDNSASKRLLIDISDHGVGQSHPKKAREELLTHPSEIEKNHQVQTSVSNSQTSPSAAGLFSVAERESVLAPFLPSKDYLSNGVLDFSSGKDEPETTTAIPESNATRRNNTLIHSADNQLNLGAPTTGELNQNVNKFFGTLNHRSYLGNGQSFGADESNREREKSARPVRRCGSEFAQGVERMDQLQMSKSSPNSVGKQHGIPSQEQIVAKGSWMCPQCMKVIKYKRNARAHLMSHAAVRPCFSCSYCDQSFTTKWNLKKHLKLNHGIDMEINDPLVNHNNASQLPLVNNNESQQQRNQLNPPTSQGIQGTPKQTPTTLSSANSAQRIADAIDSKLDVNSFLGNHFFPNLPNMPPLSNLGPLAAASGFYNPPGTLPDLGSKGMPPGMDLKSLQQLYQNLASKDLLGTNLNGLNINNLSGADASKALQALTSVNMLLQSSFFAEQMMNVGSNPALNPGSLPMNLPMNPMGLGAPLDLNTFAAQLAGQMKTSGVDLSKTKLSKDMKRDWTVAGDFNCNSLKTDNRHNQDDKLAHDEDEQKPLNFTTK